MNKSKILLIAIIVVAVAAFFVFDGAQYLSLEYLKAQRESIETLFARHPFAVAGVYFLVYVLVTSLSLPGAAIMTLAGGAIFGLLWGTAIISFASTIGATLAFLVSRFLLRDVVQSKFGDYLKTFNKGIEEDGAFYLFTLRLVPAVPFFVINLVMGLTPIKTTQFYWVSQVGMFAGTVVYVNAGTQLGQLESLSGILSPSLIGAFVLLGIFPLIARWVMKWLKARKDHHAEGA